MCPAAFLLQLRHGGRLRRLLELISLFPAIRSLRLERVIFLCTSSDINVPLDILAQSASRISRPKRPIKELDIYECRFKQPQRQLTQLGRLCVPRGLVLRVQSPKEFRKKRSSPPRRPDTSFLARVKKFITLGSAEEEPTLAELAGTDSVKGALYPLAPKLKSLDMTKVDVTFVKYISDCFEGGILGSLSVYRSHVGLRVFSSAAGDSLTSLHIELDASKFRHGPFGESALHKGYSHLC